MRKIKSYAAALFTSLNVIKGLWSISSRFLCRNFVPKKENDTFLARLNDWLWLLRDCRSADHEGFSVKIAWTLIILDASLLSGQKRQFQTINWKDKALTWSTIWYINIYTRISTGLQSWPLFYLIQTDAKCVISTGQYTGLNLTPLGEVYIFEKIKGPLTNKQNSKLGIDCVVAYEVVKVAGFFIVFQGGQRPSTRILNFFIFRKNESAMELFNMIFENTSPKGSFWQNKINYDILQLSADSRYLWSYVLKYLRKT